MEGAQGHCRAGGSSGRVFVARGFEAPERPNALSGYPALNRCFSRVTDLC